MKTTFAFIPWGLALFALGACAPAEPASMASAGQALDLPVVHLLGQRADTGQRLDWWVDTGIPIEAGSSVSVSCLTGRNLPWGLGPQFDCAGAADSEPWDKSIAPNCHFGSLVGSVGAVGQGGEPLCLGPTGSFTADRSGTLYLGFNDGERFADNSGFWDVEVDVTPPVVAGWSASPHPAGPSWVWNPNTALRVVLADDYAPAPWGRGLYFLYDGEVQGTLVNDSYRLDLTCDTRWVPPILVTPRGGDPLLSGSGDLVLAVNGSGQNGCDDRGYDQATAIVSVQTSGAGIDVTTVIDGTAYFALPPEGDVQVLHAGGSSNHLASSLVADGPLSEALYVDDAVTGFLASGSALGTITFDVSPALPWFQMQGGGLCPGVMPPSGFVEVDMDHSCERPDFGRPTVTLTTHLETE